MLTPTTRDGHEPIGRTGVDLGPIPRAPAHRSRFALLLTVPNPALALERNSLRCLLLADSASSLAPTERLLSRRNGRRIRRAQDREGSTAADELCPIERPETGRPEIEHRGFTTLRRSAADQFELRLVSQSHGLNPSVPSPGRIGDPCPARHRRPGGVVSRSSCRPALSGNSQQGLCNDADPYALLASPQVRCQSSTPACCLPVIAICASI